MPHLKVVVSAEADSAFAKDRIVNVVHFNVTSLTPDEDQICQDVGSLFLSKIYNNYAGRKIEVTSYDAEGTKPVYPNGHATINPLGEPLASGSPREIALCLSFYATRNVPRRRGRLYISMIGNNPEVLNLRPQATARNRLLDLADGLAGIGGPNVDWEVWSQVEKKGYPVTTAWVDDEWDTMRSRGLRSTLRSIRQVGA